jgi:signal transduction histidine kinase
MFEELTYTGAARFPETSSGSLWARFHGLRSEAPLLKKTFRQWIAHSLVWRYGMALFFVALALGAEKLLQHFFPYPFLLLFFAAVLASGWYGGAGPGLFAVVLSIFAVDYFFIPPLDSLVINAAAMAYCAAFIVSALLASWVSAMTKKSKGELEEAHDQLELRVVERTAELEKSNAELREKEHQLAHLSRVLTMGELTSSIAHEVTQPLTAVVIQGEACLECLSATPPNLAQARDAAERIIEDGTRAGAVLGRIRALFKKEGLAKDWLDMNEVIRELTVFLRDEAIRHHISLRTQLSPDLPKTTGDRVQLQQVVLNLIMNGMDAMRFVTSRPRDLLISSRKRGAGEILIAVEDSGVGLQPESAERVFDPFFTTKPQGIGMGLSISRSIVESHGGRVWAASRPSGGAIFEFTIPIGASSQNA